ncbi:MAG: indolepyruvate oxidoreductase subunit beta [Candidatus Aminicenantia bacterium]
MIKTVVISGVGGMGVLLASDILTEVFMRAEYDVKKSEIHGMSQRGGDVISIVRWGEKVYSPIIGNNSADYIIALEMLEGLRALPLLKPDGEIIVNTYRLNPLPVSAGLANYPENIIEILKSQVKTHIIDALKIALELGNARVMNTVMLGAIAKLTEVKKTLWIEVLKNKIPKKHVELNLSAFERGYSLKGEKI